MFNPSLINLYIRPNNLSNENVVFLVFNKPPILPTYMKL